MRFFRRWEVGLALGWAFIAVAAPCPPEVYRGLAHTGYSDPQRYLWDNWVYFDSTSHTFHRYSLSAPRENTTPDGRHDKAVIRHYTSRDGNRWEDQGVVAQGWSGSVTVVERGGAREYQLFMTTLGQNRRQEIALARSDDGHRFSEPRTVLAPSSELGYDLGTGDGVVMAWRDPYFFRDNQGNGHLYFAAKTRSSDGTVVPAVGHAISKGGGGDQWELRPPMELPGRFGQIELPNVIFEGGQYYLIVSTSDRKSDATPEREVKTRVVGYRALSPEGPWAPVNKEGGLLVDSDGGLYGFNLVQNSGEGGRWLYTAFRDVNSSQAFTLPPLGVIHFSEGGVQVHPPGLSPPHSNEN